MEIINTSLQDVFILKPKVFEDDRGYFFESFNKTKLKELLGKNYNFIQHNQSISTKGTLRGLHFQKGSAAQSKLLRVVRGSVFDVAVDLRSDSPTFKKWCAVELSDSNHLQFLIPKGFAHGFLSLEPNTVVQYMVDNYYSPQSEGGIIWNDEELNIEWPNLTLELSEKDKQLPELNQLDLKTLW